ncbi:MAG: protein-glutamate O-methyltransferase CheR [Magnetococcales bacterium]|nr:protein-glutamate O-methyltransferase CheR [Magnetococcales bacterium]
MAPLNRKLENLGPERLEHFKRYLKEKCGLIFVGNRETLLVTGLKERLVATRCKSWDHYKNILENKAGELDQLTALLTVNESYFFREAGQLELLSRLLYPRRRGQGRFRILSAGCSSGDEPYSIAMELVRGLGMDAFANVEVMGCDIDPVILARAREGIYNEYAFRGLDPEIRKRFFTPLGDGRHQVIDSIRNRVDFHQVNLAGNLVPEALNNLDAIYYRNVSIYFDKPTQKRIFHRLAGLLRPGGALVVSATEIFSHNQFLEGGGHGLARQEWNSILFFQKEERRASPTPATPPAPIPVNRETVAPSMNDGTPASTTPGDPMKTIGLKAGQLLRQNRFAEARQYCRDMQKIDALAVESHLIMGLADRHDGDYDGMITHFRKAAYADAKIWTPHFFMGEAFTALGLLPMAKRSYQTALSRLAKFGIGETGLPFHPLSLSEEELIHLCRIRVQSPATPGPERT